MASPFFPAALPVALLLFIPSLSRAQAPAPAPATPKSAILIPNGGFESSFRSNILWNGIDSSGNLAADRFAAPVLTQSGVISEQSMPVSVAIVDMNADKLPDIVGMDPVGYLRIWFNSGTPAQAKFTNCEIAPVFLSRGYFRTGDAATLNDERMGYIRKAPRIGATDSTGQGRIDFYVGNYWGEVFLVRNEGTALKPDFKPSGDPGKIEIPTTKGNAAKWGNVFSPAVWDWNNDGKADLLLGEGSYSANNIHLLINVGSAGKPTFDESNRSVLAFGDGREQISPCVVDYNGDGKMDLLVSERTGKVSLYLNKADKWKPGDEIPFASYVNAGSSPLTGGGISTVATGDLNGDGLFDIVLGKSSGRIAIAMNSGTKADPKFAAPVDVKGEGAGQIGKLPSSWEVEYGLQRGNFYGCASVVTEAEEPGLAPPEGKAALKIGYLPSPNKVMNPPTASQYSAALEADFARRDTTGEIRARVAPASYFAVHNANTRIKIGEKYTLSFKVKGSGVSVGELVISLRGIRKLGEDIVKRGQDRDAATVSQNQAIEVIRDRVTISPGTTWTEVSRPVTVTFKSKALNDPATQLTLSIDFTGLLQPMQGAFYLDDVKLTPR